MKILRKLGLLALGAASLLAAPTAYAQDGDFQGTYAGPVAGAIEHHFYLEETDLLSGRTTGSYYRDWDIGGGAMAGYDLAATDRVRIGVEASLLVGGGSPEAFVGGARYQQNARFGYRAAVKAGLVTTSRLMFFVKGGYGGDRFDIDNRAGVSGATEWSKGFVVGAGAQMKLDPGIELRLEYEHVDTSSHAVLLGLPIRF